MKNRSRGRMIEKYILWFGWIFACLILAGHAGNPFVFAAAILGGAGMSFLQSIPISDERLYFMKLPLCVWSYFLLVLCMTPLILNARPLATMLLPVPAYLSFWIDLRVAIWLDDRKQKRK